MSNVVCVKCGLEGTSKCPHCRTVFPEFPEEDRMLWFDVEALEHRIILSDEKKVSFRVYDDEDWLSVLKVLRKYLAILKDEHLKTLACKHQFEFKPGCKSSIDCGHE